MARRLPVAVGEMDMPEARRTGLEGTQKVGLLDVHMKGVSKKLQAGRGERLYLPEDFLDGVVLVHLVAVDGFK